MRRSAVMKLKPKEPGNENEMVFTTQIVQGILILNLWDTGRLKGRYCMNIETHEYETYYEEEKKWKQTRLQGLFGTKPQDYYWIGGIEAEFDTKEDRKLAEACIPTPGHRGILYRIECEEQYYSRDKREMKELRRIDRINKRMGRVPDLPKDFEDWIINTVSGGSDFAFKGEKGILCCTACGHKEKEKSFLKQTGKRILNNEKAICPGCGKKVQVKKRAKSVNMQTMVMILQDVDKTESVARHLNVYIEWDKAGKRARYSEAVRIFMLRKHPKYACEIFYNHTGKRDVSCCPYFDNSNPYNRRIESGYLYPGGIEQALQGTEYELWSRLFGQMAEEGMKLNYNKLMAQKKDNAMIRVAEYLFKGRFYQLLQETTEGISLFLGRYEGILYVNGRTIEEVFKLKDRQKINRIRDMDGGENTLEWMRWSEKTGEKIGEETLRWLNHEKVTNYELRFLKGCMSPVQIMNYVKKQQAVGYHGKNAVSVLRQWDDYLSMCRQLGKDISDEMVYRPRELKRRHNEAVEEIRKLRMIEQMKYQKEADQKVAEEMRNKYPGAEEVLEAIRSRYEYENEEYAITVPKRLVDIVKEGTALHHCAGSSERYFERIMQQETYICFLRRRSEPELPYYTIEVEPGGTIRQHRSYYDEEPGIEEIRGFLREWQSVIRKRMNQEDYRLAEVSAEKRQKNIEELKENNNTRVLQGLMEDFMEAV